ASAASTPSIVGTPLLPSNPESIPTPLTNLYAIQSTIPNTMPQGTARARKKRPGRSRPRDGHLACCSWPSLNMSAPMCCLQPCELPKLAAETSVQRKRHALSVLQPIASNSVCLYLSARHHCALQMDARESVVEMS